MGEQGVPSSTQQESQEGPSWFEETRQAAEQTTKPKSNYVDRQDLYRITGTGTHTRAAASTSSPCWWVSGSASRSWAWCLPISLGESCGARKALFFGVAPELEERLTNLATAFLLLFVEVDAVGSGFRVLLRLEKK